MIRKDIPSGMTPPQLVVPTERSKPDLKPGKRLSTEDTAQFCDLETHSLSQLPLFPNRLSHADLVTEVSMQSARNWANVQKALERSRSDGPFTFLINSDYLGANAIQFARCAAIARRMNREVRIIILDETGFKPIPHFDQPSNVTVKHYLPRELGQPFRQLIYPNEAVALMLREGGAPYRDLANETDLQTMYSARLYGAVDLTYDDIVASPFRVREEDVLPSSRSRWGFRSTYPEFDLVVSTGGKVPSRPERDRSYKSPSSRVWRDAFKHMVSEGMRGRVGIIRDAGFPKYTEQVTRHAQAAGFEAIHLEIRDPVEAGRVALRVAARGGRLACTDTAITHIASQFILAAQTQYGVQIPIRQVFNGERHLFASWRLTMPGCDAQALVYKGLSFDAPANTAYDDRDISNIGGKKLAEFILS